MAKILQKMKKFLVLRAFNPFFGWFRIPENRISLFRNKRFIQNYGKFWSILLHNFIKHKPLISEEWQNLHTNNTYVLLFYFSGQLESTDIFNLELLPSSKDHYRQLLPRFGHSLSTDSQGTLWVFGGYSFTQGGPLNDIRAFDTKNASWLPITVHFTVSQKYSA